MKHISMAFGLGEFGVDDLGELGSASQGWRDEEGPFFCPSVFVNWLRALELECCLSDQGVPGQISQQLQYQIQPMFT